MTKPKGSALREVSKPNSMQAELDALRAENEKLKKQQTRDFRLQVSEKGGVSVYGLGRFPVTLYQEQWLTLLEHSDEIQDFIVANKPRLKVKGQ